MQAWISHPVQSVKFGTTQVLQTQLVLHVMLNEAVNMVHEQGGAFDAMLLTNLN